ncbi:MAG TPA: type II toxin-antitoxin system PemK/MazF family toxin [Longimicrobiaceae bacterium]
MPDRGDFAWIDFSPQVGHEQSGLRPALVLSASRYNRPTGLALFCPVTSKVKGYPWEVPVIGATHVTGVVLADAVKNLDWRARGLRYIEPAPADVLRNVIDYVSDLIMKV